MKLSGERTSLIVAGTVFGHGIPITVGLVPSPFVTATRGASELGSQADINIEVSKTAVTQRAITSTDRRDAAYPVTHHARGRTAERERPLPEHRHPPDDHAALPCPAQQAFPIRPIRPWSKMPSKRLVKAPKIVLVDPGLLAHLSGLVARAAATRSDARRSADRGVRGDRADEAGKLEPRAGEHPSLPDEWRPGSRPGARGGLWPRRGRRGQSLGLFGSRRLRGDVEVARGGRHKLPSGDRSLRRNRDLAVRRLHVGAAAEHPVDPETSPKR